MERASRGNPRNPVPKRNINLDRREAKWKKEVDNLIWVGFLGFLSMNGNKWNMGIRRYLDGAMEAFVNGTQGTQGLEEAMDETGGWMGREGIRGQLFNYKCISDDRKLSIGGRGGFCCFGAKYAQMREGAYVIKVAGFRTTCGLGKDRRVGGREAKREHTAAK
ncbi:hypothetical protein DFJ77DRAFT_439926 [Powellomyces hirtus]|nr:hypothetical protein DFJ77DRAFT_439926 [Powellomyces hirtus]